jgi:mannose-6-phosphate isomerase-like protein (cupin superfamily)
MTKKDMKKVKHCIAWPTSDAQFSNTEESPKLWGSEFHLHNNKQYCCKAMVVIPGGKCSVHFHKQKKETFTLCVGELIVEITNITTGVVSKCHLKNVGDSITINPETPHTFYVPEDQIGPSWFVESSSEDFTYDSYRLTQSTGPASDNR